MTSRYLRSAAAALAIALTPTLVCAQSTPEGEPPPNVRMRLGPLFVNPTLDLTNAGEDTNVFNDATNPKSDYTVTVTPATDLWLRIGPTWLQSNIREDLVWYQKYASERAANNTYAVTWVVPLSRLTFTPFWRYANTRARPGFEIDLRAQRTEATYGGSVDLKMLSRTFVSINAQRAVTDFDAGQIFLNTDLRTELNRTVTSETVTLRHQVTPLTSLNASAYEEQDRFQFDPLRNSDSRGITGSIKFDPAALLKGSASFGYRDFRPATADVPGYKGSTMAVGLTYVLLGVTRVGFNATRDVQYSYDINQPYYIQTGASGSIAQQIFGPIDVVVRGGLNRLDYRSRVDAVVAVPNRTDHVQTYGAGIGYHLGRDTRIGVNVDKSFRSSALDFRDYTGWQYGLAVTYATGTNGS